MVDDTFWMPTPPAWADVLPRLAPAALVPIQLPRTTLPVAPVPLKTTPASEKPTVLPAPTTLSGASWMKTPRSLARLAPAALVPIQLPRTALPVAPAPRMSTPLRLNPIVLPSPGAVPPTVLSGEPSSSTPPSPLLLPLPRSVPAAFVPMKQRRTVAPDAGATIRMPPRTPRPTVSPSRIVPVPPETVTTSRRVFCPSRTTEPPPPGAVVPLTWTASVSTRLLLSAMVPETLNAITSRPGPLLASVAASRTEQSSAGPVPPASHEPSLLPSSVLTVMVAAAKFAVASRYHAGGVSAAARRRASTVARPVAARVAARAAGDSASSATASTASACSPSSEAARSAAVGTPASTPRAGGRREGAERSGRIWALAGSAVRASRSASGARRRRRGMVG